MTGYVLDEKTQRIFQSERYELYDCIYYDGATSDTNTNYFLNTSSGTSIAYDSANKKFTVTCGSSVTQNYVDLRSNNPSLDLNALKGKTVRFKVYIENTAQKIIGIRAYDNNTLIAYSVSSSSTGEVFIDVEIPNNSSLIIFRIYPSQTTGVWVENDTYSFKDFEVYPV